MNTKKLRQKILDLAIHGKLVPQDPNDEPASVLLERIKAEKERLIQEGKIKRSKKSKVSSDTPHYENVPFEVPSSWMWTTLGEVGTWQSGGTPSRSNKSYYGGNIPWLKTGDLNDGLITDIPESITEEAVSNSSAKLNPIGSVLIAMYGATIGKLGILTIPATTNQACCACVEYLGITQLYLFYFLLSQREAFVAKGGGGAQPNISKEIIVNTYFPLPPYAEQQRIVAEIERWFSLIDIIENGKEDLQTSIKQAKSKILDLAIHGKLVPQDPSDEPASELLKRINSKAEITSDNEHYTQLPKGWCSTILGNIFNHNTGKALNSSNKEGIMKKYLTTSNVYWNHFDLSVVKQMPFKENEINKYVVTKGDLLVCEGGDVGRSAIWNFDYDICIQNHLHRLRPKGEIIVSFYYYVLILLKENNQIGGKGIGLLGLSSNELHKITVPMPPLTEQKRIVKVIELLFKQFDKIMESL
ncbi:restriction endonuclease subunit S [Bacteroides fragilis]|uniref:restriction endonuclease subunit S n=4 Tax=Bacteroides fragilis TaxID=817 RepID=UPI0022AA3D2D|nr:restriction endonuclease subunit S [Bacteroides fragilis]MCE8599567.1 restriction endonuclease subunit S [Bacteroides fragilis]MCE8679384.1 restriction endonuclease subunit S [Bacteroides fragilis]MCZ2540894.1 restriction endonuclease subunit S [Bacteroides fragilis]